MNNSAPASRASAIAASSRSSDRYRERLHMAPTVNSSSRGSDDGSRETTAPANVFLLHAGVVEHVIRTVCHQHSLPRWDAEEFAGEVRLKLVENDYDVFRKFQNRSSIRTYLTVVIQRIYLDYRNHIWGKWRPSAAARRLGSVAIRLETLVARDRLGLTEACEHLRCNEGVTNSRDELLDLAARLPLRTHRTRVGEGELEDVQTAPHRADEEVLSDERRQLVRRISSALAAAVVALADQDRLILRLRFQEGLSVAEIARALHLDPKPLYRRLDGLLRQLREALESAGIDGAEACEIVTRNDVDISLALLGEPACGADVVEAESDGA